MRSHEIALLQRVVPLLPLLPLGNGALLASRRTNEALT